MQKLYGMTAACALVLITCQIASASEGHSLPWGDFLLRAAAQHVGREAKAVQGRCGLSLAFMQDAQQQMGRAHRPAVQTEGFVAAVA